MFVSKINQANSYRNYLACLFILTTGLPNLCSADITDYCLRADAECIEPEKSAYTYHVETSNGTYSSLEDIVTFLESLSGNHCNREANANSASFTGYSEIGTGDIQPNYHWKLSNNSYEKILDGIQLDLYTQTVNGCTELNTSYLDVWRARTVECPANSLRFQKSLSPADLAKGEAVCVRFFPSPTELCDTTQNPCQISTGAKLRTETDFSMGDLSFVRSYHSQSLTNLGFGKGWHSRLYKRLSWQSGPDSYGRTYYMMSEGPGTAIMLLNHNGSWSVESGADRNKYSVQNTSSGFRIEDRQQRVYEFDVGGRLVSESNQNGVNNTYQYDSNDRLVQVNDRYQRAITFTYQPNGLLDTMVDPTGAAYQYEFDQHANLTTVRFPDNTPNTPTDNPTKVYHYEDTAYPNHLTGITDENGYRYATFSYDSNGKVISSELGITTNPVGQQKIQLDYQGGSN